MLLFQRSVMFARADQVEHVNALKHYASEITYAQVGFKLGSLKP